MAKGIRSYGPGKFNDIIDGYAYELTLDGGADREESYPEGGGWYGFIAVDDATRDRVHEIAAEAKDELTKEEEELLDDTVAIILFERSDGIIEADWFDDAKKAEKQWAAIEAEFEDMDDEGDDEPDDEAFSDEEMQSGYVISDARRGGYDVVHEHKHVGHYEDMDEALDAIKEEMERSKFFPNVYYVNDHGNVDLLDGDGNVIESRV